MHLRRTRHGAELAVDRGHQFADSVRRASSPARPSLCRGITKAIANLSLELVLDPDHRDFGTPGGADALLDLARAQPVAGDVDDVVGAAEDEVIAVGVAYAPVERRVDRPALKLVQ